MKLILWNLRELWKRQRLFFGLLVLVQALAAFCLAFIVGVIINNRLFLKMNYLNDYINIDLKTPVTYGQIEETMIYIFDDVLNGGGREIDMSSDNGKKISDPDFFVVWSVVGIKNGRYIAGPTLTDTIQLQLESGRLFSEDELNSSECMVIASAEVEADLVLDGERCKIIGRRVRALENEIKIALVNPVGIRNRNLNQVIIYLKRYLTKEEYQGITEALDRVIAGKYELGGHDVIQGVGDAKAVLESVILSCVMIGLVLSGCLGTIYQHILDKRTYDLAIWRLTGCSALCSIRLLLLEMLLLSAPSLALGLGGMYLLQKRKLEEIYPYMANYLNGKMYLMFFWGMLIFIALFQTVVMSARLFRSVKSQLLAAKRG